MAKFPRLQRRAGRYHFRCAIPVNLTERFGCRELTRSLRTGEYAEAKRRVIVASLLADELIQMARDNPSMSREEIHALIKRWFQEKLDQDLERRINGKKGPSRQQFFADNAKALKERVLSASDSAGNEGFAKGVIAKETIFASLNGACTKAELQDFGHYALRGSSQIYEILAAREQGDFSDKIADPFFAPVQHAQAIGQTNQGAKGISLVELIQRYTDDPARANLSGKTKSGYKTVYKLLTEVLGEKKAANKVNREDCRRIQALLLRMPPNAVQRFPNLTARQAADHADKEDLPRLKPTAVNSYLNNLSALFKWAVQEEYMTRNPAQKLTIDNPVKAKDRRNPFSTDQLTAIFKAPLYTGCKDDEQGYARVGTNKPRRGRFWVPLLSLWTGMRLNECCQLLVKDVKVIDGTNVIVVQEDSESDEADKRVKSDAGERFVPVHPELVNIGFLRYVEQVKKGGKARLFPELSAGTNGYYSDPFSKWFARFLSKAGAKQKRTAFHSFRHNYRDAMREASISKERVQALGGWAGSGGAEDDYGSGLRPSTLYKEICKVSYPDLDLKHLHMK